MQYVAGGTFGERALLLREPRAASVIPRTDARLLRLSKDRSAEGVWMLSAFWGGCRHIRVPYHFPKSSATGAALRRYQDLLLPRIERLRGVKIFELMGQEELEDCARCLEASPQDPRAAGQSTLKIDASLKDASIVRHCVQYIHYRTHRVAGTRFTFSEQARTFAKVVEYDAGEHIITQGETGR